MGFTLTNSLKPNNVYALVVGIDGEMELSVYQGLEENDTLTNLGWRHRFVTKAPLRDGVIIYRINNPTLIGTSEDYINNRGEYKKTEDTVLPNLHMGKLFSVSTYAPFNDGTIQGTTTEERVGLLKLLDNVGI